ncbi:MAG: polymer-forming cytoskeletal protein [Balneolaceae bacterium]|nr:polymer-forming cytoskeletal protein [Balneolaceae bacterium]MDR9408750.1 polymer-forming cytoskeletal protein [Balneolaceae bacterium]
MKKIVEQNKKRKIERIENYIDREFKNLPQAKYLIINTSVKANLGDLDTFVVLKSSCNVNGDIYCCGRVELNSSAVVKGKIFAEKIIIQEGASGDFEIIMGFGKKFINKFYEKSELKPPSKRNLVENINDRSENKNIEKSIFKESDEKNKIEKIEFW